MALSLLQTEALARILRPGMRVASFGYPDMIFPAALEGLLPDKSPRYLLDSSAICKRHGIQDRPIPDAVSLFYLLGCELDVYDVWKERGCEIVCDLNYSFVREEVSPSSEYNVVLDVGTAEHCFNIGQALMNMAGMVKKDGYIIHENPHSGWGNHGFYSLHPTLFHDFYTQNGFEIESCLLNLRSGGISQVPPTGRYKGSNESNVFAMARRVKVQPFVFPVQSKYAKLMTVAGFAGVKETVNG